MMSTEIVLKTYLVYGFFLNTYLVYVFFLKTYLVYGTILKAKKGPGSGFGADPCKTSIF